MTSHVGAEVVDVSQDAVGATREALTAAAAVLRIRNEYGDTLGVRRLTSDVDRLASRSTSSATRSRHRPGGPTR